MRIIVIVISVLISGCTGESQIYDQNSQSSNQKENNKNNSAKNNNTNNKTLPKTTKQNTNNKTSGTTSHGSTTVTNNTRVNPIGVEFQKDTLRRLDGDGDNWCITWTADDNQVTSMCDGSWSRLNNWTHNRLFVLSGGPDDFTHEPISAYPNFVGDDDGWFGYGVIAIGNKLYSMVSKTPGPDWSGPFRGSKLLRSSDNGKSWYQIGKDGNETLVGEDRGVRNDVSSNAMFFMEDFGKTNHGQEAWPFSWVSFVQNGKAAEASPDDYVYIYAPESSNTHELLLARVKESEFEKRANWEFFKGWNGDSPTWSKNIEERKPVMIYPEKNEDDNYFGWYSWLPSVVWNKGLNLYIMVNGGTYGGDNMTANQGDYYDSGMHSKTGSLGFWYSEKPYGPWKKFYYTSYFKVDDEKNRTYQPKLSPKWMSKDGKEMTLIWSDAGKNDEGQSHDKWYLWNQMKITIKLQK